MADSDTSIGSVEGIVETVCTDGDRRFTIYHSMTGKEIHCDVPRDSDLLDQAEDALGKRVVVSGTVHTDARGDAIRVSAEMLRLLNERPALPSIASLGGKYPDFTGDLTTEEYVRSLRDS